MLKKIIITVLFLVVLIIVGGIEVYRESMLVSNFAKKQVSLLRANSNWRTQSERFQKLRTTPSLAAQMIYGVYAKSCVNELESNKHFDFALQLADQDPMINTRMIALIGLLIGYDKLDKIKNHINDLRPKSNEPLSSSAQAQLIKNRKKYCPEKLK